MDKSEWESLNFDPSKDGKWATVEEIQRRIRQKKKDDLKIKAFIVSAFIATTLFLTLLIWLLL
jgi:hypothetical protein